MTATASNLESIIEVVNDDAELSDQAISAVARLLIALADVESESEDAQENMDVGQ